MYSITSSIYLDKFKKCYNKVLTIKKMPTGELSNHIKCVQTNKLSPFKHENQCGRYRPTQYIIMDSVREGGDSTKFLEIQDVTELFMFLSENDYTVDTSVTTIKQNSDVKIKNLLCCKSIPSCIKRILISLKVFLLPSIL